MEPRRARTLLSAALALALVGAACGSSSDDKEGAGATTVAPPSSKPGGKALAVTAIDYAYTGVPPTVAAGTEVSLTNSSKKEVHEVVALRVRDGETRPASALLQLPEAERDKAAEFRGVVVAFPGEPGFAPAGPLVLSQPGRYLLVCTIPTGADPVAYREAAKKGPGPVVVPGGPPHAAKGMVSELTVT